MLDLETRDAFNIVNDPNIKEEKDIRMAMALIKNLYKEGKIDGEIYDKAMLNAKIMIFDFIKIEILLNIKYRQTLNRLTVQR